MTFDHDFGYSFSLFSSLLKKEDKEKENELAKFVNKSHDFQPSPQIRLKLAMSNSHVFGGIANFGSMLQTLKSFQGF